MLGFAGKILRVNLSSGAITTDEPDEEFYRTYLGGAGLVSYYLLKEIPSGVDALSPENRLVWAIGPMTGLPFPGNSRSCVGTKSPLTDGFSKSEAGGFFPMALKQAGYDAIIVEGKAEKPVYLLVTDEKVELQDASHLWGKTVLETQDLIAEETGIQNIRTSSIGPGGENMVRFACIMNDLKEAHGRGGTGAVMGSKNLKAIAAFGSKRPEVADTEKVQELARWMGQNFKDQPLFGAALSKVGTGEHFGMLGNNEIGNIPSHNFDINSFDDIANITADTTLDTYGVGMDGCAACGVRCKKTVKIGEPWNVDPRNGGPEYESLGSLGSTCDVGDLAAVCKANELANLYSLDTISLGVTIAFGMECYEKELLNLEDTNGVELKFGSGDALVKAVEMIARRQGTAGDILAEGTKKAAERIGKGSEDFAVHVKGVEIPMHDPRVKQGLGIVYAVEAHGADHCAGMHDTAHTQPSAGVDHLMGMGAAGPMRADDLGMDKVITEKAAHTHRLFVDSLVCCSMLPWTIWQHAEIVRALTGWYYTTREALQTGERVATLGRIFNLREGLTTADDTLPKRMFEPTQKGGLKNGGIDREKMQKAIGMFYGAMGWNEQTGIPTDAKLGELKIGWAADSIPV